MFLANFLIGLREGLEASMVVMILVAFLVKSRRRDLLPQVWIGVAAALAATITAFLIIQFGTKTLTSQGQELVGGIFSLVTVALISIMLLWMKDAAKKMATELNDKMATAVNTGKLAVVTVAFIAVIREGIETALLVFDSFSYGDTTGPALALTAGIAISVAIAWLMYKGAVKVNLGVFFQITGALLIVVAAGILRYGVTDLQEAGVLPGLNNLAFDISGVLQPGTTAATLIEGIFNLVPAPSLLSMIAWAAYLVLALWLFFKPSRGQPVAEENTQHNHPQPAA